MNQQTKFLLVNNFLILVALIGAVFQQPGIYITFFAISVAMQITQFKRQEKK